MPPEENQPGSPQDWMRFARSDLELAKITPPPGVLLEGLCFHTQQAAEKALKAVLVSYGISFPMTHSLRILLDLLHDCISIPEEVEDASSLTDYSVMARYPGDIEIVDEKEYHEAIHLAETVVSWAEDIIRR